MCARANWSIYTHIQWPAEGVLHHTAPLLCILTLWWQVLVQETIELLQSWQPAHHKEGGKEEAFVIVSAWERGKRETFQIYSFAQVLPKFKGENKWFEKKLERSLRYCRKQKRRQSKWTWRKEEANKKGAWKIWSYTQLTALSAQKGD